MKNSAYVGLDVHKLTMAIAIAEAGASSEVRFFGEIANSPRRRRVDGQEIGASARKVAVRV
jgi:hypothetical protein